MQAHLLAFCTRRFGPSLSGPRHNTLFLYCIKTSLNIDTYRLTCYFGGKEGRGSMIMYAMSIINATALAPDGGMSAEFGPALPAPDWPALLTQTPRLSSARVWGKRTAWRRCVKKVGRCTTIYAEHIHQPLHTR